MSEFYMWGVSEKFLEKRPWLWQTLGQTWGVIYTQRRSCVKSSTQSRPPPSYDDYRYCYHFGCFSQREIITLEADAWLACNTHYVCVATAGPRGRFAQKVLNFMFVQKIKPAYSYLFGIMACLFGPDHRCCDYVSGIVTQLRSSSISSFLGWLRLQNLFLFLGKKSSMAGVIFAKQDLSTIDTQRISLLEFNSNYTLYLVQAWSRAPIPLERL